jgi:hypothetical protein
VDREVVIHLLGQGQAAADLVPVQVLVLDRLVEPLDHAVVWGERCRVRTWVRSGRLAVKRAKPTER